VYDLTTGAADRLYDVPTDSSGDTYVIGPRLEWSADSTRIGFIMEDVHNEGRAIAYTIAAEPGATVREEMQGITPIVRVNRP
jgi:hypothetical protein